MVCGYVELGKGLISTKGGKRSYSNHEWWGLQIGAPLNSALWVYKNNKKKIKLALESLLALVAFLTKDFFSFGGLKRNFASLSALGAGRIMPFSWAKISLAAKSAPASVFKSVHFFLRIFSV